MTIYIPVWLYWYGVPPLVFLLGYLLGWTRKREVPPDPYLREWTAAETGEVRPRVAAQAQVDTSKDAPTTKRARPVDARDEDES